MSLAEHIIADIKRGCCFQSLHCHEGVKVALDNASDDESTFLHTTLGRLSRGRSEVTSKETIAAFAGLETGKLELESRTALVPTLLPR